MKCDVCLTKIPLGQNRCPNCGYIVRPEGKTTFNEVSPNHEHIDTDIPSIHDEPPVFKSKQKTNSRKLISVFISLGLATFLILMTGIFYMLDEEEVVHGDEEVIQELSDWQDDLASYLSDQGFIDLYLDEPTEYSTMYESTVSATKGNFDYQISCIKDTEDSLTHYTMTIFSYEPAPLDLENPYIDEQAIEILENYFNKPNLLELIKENYKNLEQDEDEYYVYDDVYISINMAEDNTYDYYYNFDIFE